MQRIEQLIEVQFAYQPIALSGDYAEMDSKLYFNVYNNKLLYTVDKEIAKMLLLNGNYSYMGSYRKQLLLAEGFVDVSTAGKMQEEALVISQVQYVDNGQILVQFEESKMLPANEVLTQLQALEVIADPNLEAV